MIHRVLSWLHRSVSSSAARSLTLGLVLALVWRIYWFIGSAGLPGEWPRYMDYYDLLAEGFRSGHLYVPVSPNPALLSKADPYDPAHVGLWYWDVSLWRGRYYMYWGPVPGIIQAAVKSSLGINRIIGDQYLVFGMFSLAALGGALLIERLQRRLFPRVPWGLVLIGVLAFCLANPAPYLVASGGVYQASIGAAQAFLLLGAVFAFDAVWAAQGGGLASLRLIAASFFWALALGSRVSMAPCIALLVVLTVCACHLSRQRRSREWRLPLRAALLLALPLTMGWLSLLVYNKLRFDSYLEFGTNVQLSTLKFRISTDYWLVNLYTYLLRPFKSECTFPYAFATWYPPAKTALAGWMGVPEGYLLNEPVVGWLRVVAVAWWLPVAVLVAVRKLRRLLASRATVTAMPDTDREFSASNVTYVFCAATFGLLGSVTAFALLGLYMATMRYLSDVTNGLVLLGLMGAFTVYSSRVTRWGRALTSAAMVASFSATIVFGLLLGYQGYNGHFKQFNPTLDVRTRERFPACDVVEPQRAHHSRKVRKARD
jgi:hypothetical protein